MIFIILLAVCPCLMAVMLWWSEKDKKDKIENMKYKVGDSVKIKSLNWYNEHKDETDDIECSNNIWFYKEMSKFCGKVMTISHVRADHYTMVEDLVGYWTDEMIEGLVEEETKPNIIEEAKTYWDSIKDAWICPEGYIFKDENGNVINATKIVLEKKKKEYPKTYEECYKIMGVKLSDCYIQGYKSPLLEDLQELLICRDAYWKIAGEEMGLNRPWEPDGNAVYAITRNDGYIVHIETGGNDEVLEFPTAEMRDQFHNNFNKEIEICKNLL